MPGPIRVSSLARWTVIEGGEVWGQLVGWWGGGAGGGRHDGCPAKQQHLNEKHWHCRHDKRDCDPALRIAESIRRLGPSESPSGRTQCASIELLCASLHQWMPDLHACNTACARASAISELITCMTPYFNMSSHELNMSTSRVLLLFSRRCWTFHLFMMDRICGCIAALPLLQSFSQNASGKLLLSSVSWHQVVQ